MFLNKQGGSLVKKHVFFDVEKMMEFAQNTKEQIIVWDEPALQALSTDWASQAVKNITRLLMMARKKRHFFIFNLTKFYKFNEYIVVDRPMALIHVYSRKNVESGRFMYIRKKWLESLWRDYRFAKKRSYKLYSSKKIRGTFPDILNPEYKNNVLSEFDNDEYERRKDEAIKSIGKKKVSDKQMKWLEQRNILINLIKKESGIGGLSLSKKLKESGINLSRSAILDICAASTTVQL